MWGSLAGPPQGRLWKPKTIHGKKKKRQDPNPRNPGKNRGSGYRRRNTSRIPILCKDSYVASLVLVNKRSTIQTGMAPHHVRLSSGIVHHQVTRTHSVVDIDDEFVVVQRTCSARLANDLLKSHKRSRRGMGTSTVLNQNLQGPVLTQVDLL